MLYVNNSCNSACMAIFCIVKSKSIDRRSVHTADSIYQRYRALMAMLGILGIRVLVLRRIDTLLLKSHSRTWTLDCFNPALGLPHSLINDSIREYIVLILKINFRLRCWLIIRKYIYRISRFSTQIVACSFFVNACLNAVSRNLY